MLRSQNQLVDALTTLSLLWKNSDKKILQQMVLIKRKILSYKGPMITHLELEDNKWLERIRRYWN